MQQKPAASSVISRYWLFLALYAAGISLYLWMTRANTVPGPYVGTAADPATFMNPEELRVSEIYPAIRNGLFFLSYPWEWGIYIILLFGGWARRFQDRLEAWRLPAPIRFVVFVAWVNVLSFAAFMPIRVLGYRLSRHYNISTQGAGSWLRDKLVALGVDTLMLAVITGVAFWIIRRGGRWWLKLWLLSIPFTVFLMYIQPVVIDPLYNTFTRLSNPVLEQHILDLAHQAGVSADRVYEVDMSAKTNALNAYVNGIGPSLRIVLWDTLFRLEDKEILLIMAHELGHYVKHHLEWSALGAIGTSFVMLWLGSRVLQGIVRKWGSLWGITRMSDLAVLPLILLVVSVFSFVSLPVSNYISRQAEGAADAYAMQLIGSADGAVTMHQKLAKVTYDEVDPPLLVHWFRSSHPTTMERILDAQAFERRNSR
jgi:STE24 endopeptidase